MSGPSAPSRKAVPPNFPSPWPAGTRCRKSDKDAIQAANPEAFVQDRHYDGYGAVIVRLEAIDESDLADLLNQGRDEMLGL